MASSSNSVGHILPVNDLEGWCDRRQRSRHQTSREDEGSGRNAGLGLGGFIEIGLVLGSIGKGG